MSRAYRTADYLKLPRPDQPFVVDKLLPVGGAMLIYGDPKIGKSYAALELAQSITRGEEWLEFTCHKHVVLYVQLDTPRGLWTWRIEKLDESGEPVVDNDLWQADRESLGTWPFDILNQDHWSRLRGLVDDIKPGVVIVDTLKESHQLSENDNTDGQRVIAALVGATQPAALILIHHARKPSDGRPNDLVGGARGASYLTGRMDAIIAFTSRGMHYVSRAIEAGTVKLERKDNGFWDVNAERASVNTMIETLAQEGESTSLREKARRLAAATGMKEEGARSMLRRWKGPRVSGSLSNPPVTILNSTT